MKKARKFIALLMALILCLGALVGCSSNTEKASGEKTPTEGEAVKDDVEQVFTFHELSPVTGLNPILNTTGPDNGLHHIILETLVADVADENGKSVLKPAAAKDWKISDDGTVYTFNIREDAVWNDGVPVKAQDFVYTYQMMATPSVGSTNAWLFEGIILNFSEALYNDGKDPKYNKKPEDIGVKAINDKTIEFTLVKPCAYFLDLLDGAKPIRQDKYEEWGEEYGSSLDKVVTNGPFTVQSWDANTQMTLVKNEKYWDAKNVKLTKIVRKVIQDPATAAQALISGDVDLVSTKDPDWQKLIKEDGKFEMIATPGNGPEFYGFNCANKYFKNSKIRLAFALGYDRQKFVDDLRHGVDVPIYTMIPEGTNVGDKLYSERINGKNQIIKALQEKYPNPKDLLIEGLKEEGLDPDPAKMEVKLASRGTNEFSKKSGEWMLQQWKENLGVTITIDMMEWNIMWDKVDAGDYDIATAGWGPYYNDPNGLLSVYEPVNGYFDSKKSGWTGPDAEKYTELLTKADNSTDQQERAELLLQAEELIVGTGVISPTYVNTDIAFLAKKVKGYHVNPHSQLDYTKIYITNDK